MENFENYFEGKTNLVYDRSKFRKRKQEFNEHIEKLWNVTLSERQVISGRESCDESDESREVWGFVGSISERRAFEVSQRVRSQSQECHIPLAGIFTTSLEYNRKEISQECVINIC